MRTRHFLATALLALLFGGPPACAGSPADDTGTGTDAATTGDGTTVVPTGTVDETTAGTTEADATDTGTTHVHPETTGGPNEEHEAICTQIHAAMGLHGGFDIPGVSGSPRWGIPDPPPAQPRVRRSWSTLDDGERQKVVDAFLALKFITKDSGDPGSERADYTSFCDVLGLQSYARNLYDFYVEAHANAWVSMMTPYEEAERHVHMGPQFLPWHRYLLLRVEADMAEAIGDPEFALPYWDWTDCYADGAPTDCAWLFQPQHLGTAGSCDNAMSPVTGYLVDQGFLTNLYTNEMGPPPFVPASIQCGQRAITRKVGCLVPAPPGADQITAVFDRLVYDAPPYDSCHVDEDVSFRQFLEGYDDDSTDLNCVAAGCGIHGQGHFFVGGDMQFSSANPNDPMFFLHHAQVDRVWAAWQAANLASGDADRMVDHGNPAYPDDYRGPLFVFDQVQAAELFDHQALGYEYDSLPTPN